MKFLSKRLGKNERGFTLPEVLIVVAILGILLAIAVPVWWNVVEGRRVDSAANQFASDLRLAHNKATNQLQDWTVEYQIGSGGSGDYQLVSEKGDVINRSLPDDTVVYGSEVSDASNNGAIKFTSQGQAEPGTGMTFNDADGDDEIDVAISQDGAPAPSISTVRPTSRVEID